MSEALAPSPSGGGPEYLRVEVLRGGSRENALVRWLEGPLEGREARIARGSLRPCTK